MWASSSMRQWPPARWVPGGSRAPAARGWRQGAGRCSICAVCSAAASFLPWSDFVQGTQATVVIISSSKKKGNATEEAEEAAAAADAKESASQFDGGSGGHDRDAPTLLAGGTGSLGSGVAALLAGNDSGGRGSGGKSEAELAAAEHKQEKKKELEEKIEAAAEADVDRIIDSKDNEYVLSKPNE